MKTKKSMIITMKVKVIELESNDVLFTCESDEQEKAYAYAAQMEEFGLQVKVLSPSVFETLAFGLGVEGEELEEFVGSVTDELEDHAGRDSCCHRGCCYTVSQNDGPKDC